MKRGNSPKGSEHYATPEPVIKGGKLQGFGSVTRHGNKQSLVSKILRDRVPGKRGKGRTRKTWLTGLKEWKPLKEKAEEDEEQQKEETKKTGLKNSLLPRKVYLRLR